MLFLWLISCLGIYQARAAILSRKSPFFENDYLEIVKDIPEFKTGYKVGYGWELQRELTLLGPTSFPVITNNDGNAFIAAGRYGKVKGGIPSFHFSTYFLLRAC